MTLKILNNSDFQKYSDYPLNEDRILESFLPFKDIHSGLNFSKYKRNRIQPLDSYEESLMRKKRIVDCVERILLNKNTEKKCFIALTNENKTIDSVVEKFQINLEICPKESETKLSNF